MKIRDPNVNKIIRTLLLCHWLNLTPDEVENLTLEEYMNYSNAALLFETRKGF